MFKIKINLFKILFHFKLNLEDCLYILTVGKCIVIILVAKRKKSSKLAVSYFVLRKKTVVLSFNVFLYIYMNTFYQKKKYKNIFFISFSFMSRNSLLRILVV